MSGILYSIGLNPAQYLSGAGQVRGATAGMHSSVTGLAGRVMTLTNVFTLAGQAMRAIQAVKGPLMLGADMEKTEVGMNTVIKNLKITRGLIAELRTLGAKTPLELPELTGGARQMLGAGWKLGDIVKDLTTFGDVAAAAQTDLAGIVTVMTQVKGKGKLMAEELMQLSERGVAGLRDALAAVRKTSTGKLSEDMEKGLVSVKDLMNAFRRMTGEGGIFFKAMENQSKTTYGLLSTLRDGVNQIWLAFSQPLNEALKPYLQSSIVLADKLSSKARNLVGTFQVLFADDGKGMQAAIGWLFNPNLWRGIGNYLSLALETAAHKFLATMIGGWRDFNATLPKMMRSDDKPLASAQSRHMKAGREYSAAMTQQGTLIAEAFTKGFATTSNVWLNASTAARLKYTTTLEGEKGALKKATQGASWFQTTMGTLAEGFKQAVAHMKKAKEDVAAPPKKSGRGGDDDDADDRFDSDGRRKTDGRSRIRGFQRADRKKRPSGLDYLTGRGLSGENNLYAGPSPLDYLKGKGLTKDGGVQPRTMTQRERTLGVQKGDPAVIRLLEEMNSHLKGFTVQ